jgi:tRNA (adenine57-N1/adenine58-N1)-methyltransferase catalytic subunit
MIAKITLTEHPLPAQPEPSSWLRPQSAQLAAGDLVLLMTSDEKRYLITLQPHHQHHTHQGIYLHDDLIGRAWGDEVHSQLGQAALLLVPGLNDLMTHLRRGTQIIYPKDAAFLVHRLSLRAGCRVIEAGTGSGGLTVALAWAVAPTGVIYTYESRIDNYQLAQRNLERVGLRPYVQCFHGAVEDGFQQQGVDALVLDLREPWRFLEQVRAALRPGSFFASLLPTTNQVSELLYALEREHFVDISVEEILLRGYKPVPDRLRPFDTMAAHTGYLIFARPVAKRIDASLWHAKERQRYRARKQFEAEVAAEAERRAIEGNPDGRKYPRLPLPG